MAVGWTDKQTCTGWSCPVDPFKCIAGPTPDGWMTSAESFPDSGAAVDSVISPTTESLSSVFTTPFILTTVQSFKTVSICNQVEHIQASMFSKECLILRNYSPQGCPDSGIQKMLVWILPKESRVLLGILCDMILHDAKSWEDFIALNDVDNLSDEQRKQNSFMKNSGKQNFLRNSGYETTFSLRKVKQS